MPSKYRGKAIDHNDFRTRLSELVTDDGRGISDLAKASGIPYSSLHSYLREGGPEPTRPKLVSIASATGVNLEWLLAGKGSKFGFENNATPKTVPAKAVGGSSSRSYVQIPFYPNVRASAGAGANGDDETSECPFAIQGDWLRRAVGRTSDGLALLSVDGDSMEPTLRRGDIILLDHKDATPRDGIFVLVRDEYLHVKRLQYRDAHSVRVISDNCNLYPAYDLDLKTEDQSTRIVGRVIGVTHKI